MPKRGSWRSQFGFYLIAIGSAFGLGNLWRFPYIVGENGGGAFIVLYILLSLTVGMTFLITELMLGRKSQSSLLVTVKKLSPPGSLRFRGFGVFGLVLCFVVLSYYSVVSGWVLHFLTQFFVALFKPGHLLSMSQQSLNTLLNNGWMQFLIASVHILISLVLVAKGVQEGLEKWVARIMPLFALLVLILVVRAMSLPSAGEVLRFLFYPDFSKLTLKSLAHAMGHVCFTLSIGFGTIVTFGSYLKEDAHLPTVGMRVTLLDTLISLVAVLLVFPVAFQGAERPLQDPTLLFEALPKFFYQIQGGEFFGLIFFLCLWLAALNASIGLLESMVANLMDYKPGIPRARIAWLVGSVVLFLTLIPSLSGTVFKSFRLFDLSLIELVDSLVINWFLPLSALMIGYMFYRSYNVEERKELFVDENNLASVSLFKDWEFSLKWFGPSIILAGFLFQFLALFF